MPAFPALDEEPPPPRPADVLRRAGIVVAVAVVLAGLGFGVSRIHIGGQHDTASSAGTVLAETTAQGLVQARPDGSGQQPYAKFTYLGGGGGATVSGDRTALITSTGAVVTLHDGRPVTTSQALFRLLSSANASPFSLVPFADGAKDVVASYDLSPTGTSRVLIASTAGTDRHELGVADAYAGDPAAAGAFVAVPDTSSKPIGSLLPDTRVELRAATGATSTVATAAQVAEALGGTTGNDLSLDPVPDPTGQRLSIEARSLTRDVSLGVAVFSRTGRLVSRLVTPLSSAPAWSPSGREMIFSSAGRAIAWSPGHPSTRITLPPTARLLGPCAWSPSEKSVACAAYLGVGSPIDAWLQVDLRQARATAGPAAGIPLVWSR